MKLTFEGTPLEFQEWVAKMQPAMPEEVPDPEVVKHLTAGRIVEAMKRVRELRPTVSLRDSHTYCVNLQHNLKLLPYKKEV